MTAVLVYGGLGRGAWPANGLGGTLSLDGARPGPFYRLPAKGSGLAYPGLVGRNADRDSTTVGISQYAVSCAVGAIQTVIGAAVDRVFGPRTSAALKVYQAAHGLDADGVAGRATTTAMFAPLLAEAVGAVIGAHPDLADISCGHLFTESRWDPGAVGISTPRDLGLAQINGEAHPGVTAAEQFDPDFALPWLVDFVAGNLAAFWDDIDCAIAAYLLGQGGSRSWRRAGKPAIYGRTDVAAYVAKVKAGC